MQNTDLQALACEALAYDNDSPMLGLTVACMLSLCEDSDIQALMTPKQQDAYQTLCRAIENNDDGDDAFDDQETVTDMFIEAFSQD